MSEDYRGRWVRALRSGNFKRAKNYLSVEDIGTGEKFHCCLGVAAEIFHEEMEIPKTDNELGTIRFGGCTAYLPSLISTALGLNQDIQTRLTMMNDNNVPWDTIANWIEEHVPENPDQEDETGEEETTSGD